MGGRPRARRPDPPCPGGSAEDRHGDRTPHRALRALRPRRGRAARAVAAAAAGRDRRATAHFALRVRPASRRSGLPGPAPRGAGEAAPFDQQQPQRPPRGRAGAPRARRRRHRVRCRRARASGRYGTSALRRPPHPSRRPSIRRRRPRRGIRPEGAAPARAAGRRARRRRPSARTGLPPDPPRRRRRGLDTGRPSARALRGADRGASRDGASSARRGRRDRWPRVAGPCLRGGAGRGGVVVVDARPSRRSPPPARPSPRALDRGRRLHRLPARDGSRPGRRGAGHRAREALPGQRHPRAADAAGRDAPLRRAAGPGTRRPSGVRRARRGGERAPGGARRARARRHPRQRAATVRTRRAGGADALGGHAHRAARGAAGSGPHLPHRPLRSRR